MSSSRNLSKVLLFGIDNVSSIAFGLLGSAFLARAFGPENLGRLSTVQATTALLVFLTTLGLDHYWVRELHRDRRDGILIGSAQLAQWTGWLVHLGALLAFTWLQGNLQRDLLLVLAVAVTTFFTRTLFVALYFSAIGNARPIAISAVASRLLALGYLLWGFQQELAYEWMVMYLPLQAAIQGIYLAWQFWQVSGKALRYGLHWPRVGGLLREAAPILMATALFPIFAQADVLVIAHFLGPHDVGIYAAATRLLPQLLFLGHILAAAFFPAIIARHDAAAADYRQYTLKVARAIVALSLSASISVALLAPIIIHLLYGEAFAASVPVLQIACWGWVFILPAALYARLLVLEGLGRIELIKTAVTSAISIALNTWLIPRYGILAAASVSIISYFLTDLALYAVFRSTRPLFFIAVHALFDWFIHPWRSLRETRQLFSDQA